MGFKLRREVRDLLPPGVLTANERLLVLELADNCRDDSDENGPAREGWPGFDWLAEKTDIREDKLGETFSRIAKKWTELRVPLGHGKDGRPYFSRTGVRTRYRFPGHEDLVLLKKLAAEAPENGGPAKSNEAPRNGGPEAPENRRAEAPENGNPRPPVFGGPNPSGFPQRTTSDLSSGANEPAPVAASLALVPSEKRERGRVESNSSKPKGAAHAVLAAKGITGDEADQIIASMRFVVGGDTKGSGWWRTVDKNGDLGDLIAQAQERIALFSGLADEIDRAPSVRIVSNSEHVHNVRHLPDCGHGYNGGNVAKPGDGWVHCASCRVLAERGLITPLQMPDDTSAPNDVWEGVVTDEDEVA